jgi:signal transduction histidine kinase/ligand-binding sensor domain-containing protein/AraC-like DNA-binding protein
MRDPTKYCYLLFLLIIFLSNQTTPQTHISENKIHFTHLTKEKGLSDSFDWCILQDKKGFFWIGTSDGLDRYEGGKFKTYKYSHTDVSSIGANTIRALYEDNAGTLWVGTEGGGLNRYNSAEENFTRFIHDPNNSASISSNVVTSIHEDKFGILWVGTRDGGLNEFSRKDEKFICYKHDPDNEASISSNTISPIYEDSNGNLWIGTVGGGLNKFDKKNKKFSRFVHNPDNPFSLSHNDISGISGDNFGNIWISTLGGGLNKLNYIDDQHLIKFSHVKNNPSDPTSLSNNNVATLFIDNDNIMWIGTWGGGLNKTALNPGQNSSLSFISYKHNYDDEHSLSDDNISYIYKDKTGLLWVATWGGGIHIYNTKQKSFRHYTHEPDNPFSMSAKGVSVIYEDRYRTLWIGTWDGGLNKMDRATNKFVHYQHNPNEESSLSNNAVSAIYEDKFGVLWIGTWQGGLNKFDEQSNKFYHYKNDPLNTESISDDRIVTIGEDPDGEMWIGTYYGGLNKFERKTGKFIRYQHDDGDSTSLSNNSVSVIYRDREKNLWIGTRFGGLDKLDFIEGKFYHNKFYNGSVNPNKIVSIYEDVKGVLWIGTQELGLIKLNKETGHFKNYTVKDGLPGNYILGILEDESGNLWLSTNPGLSMFNPLKESFRNYDVDDGLQSNEFEEYPASYKTRAGELIFGGINGFNIFYPDSIKDNLHIPPVFLTDFYLFNQRVPIGYDSLSGRTILTKSLLECEEIELNFFDKVFSFEFVALDLHAPHKNKYAYILKGFDKDWIYTNAQRRTATYTNLDPGEYTFRVKGSNNDGIWNEQGASIKVIILPPWWRTNLAYLIYILLLVSVIYFIWKAQLKRIRTKHEFEMSRFEAQKLHEVDEMKSKFFTNISHEFRTPLTLILGPSKQLSEELKDERTKIKADLIHRSANKLNRLVDELLDFSKIEAGEMKLKACPVNLVLVVKEIVLSFQSLAERKQITFKFNCNDNEIIAYLDKNKVEKIIANVLSNAFKFTPEGGKVAVEVQTSPKSSPKERTFKDELSPPGRGTEGVGTTKGFAEISIRDTGIGIPQNKIDKIFDRFYQVDSSHTREHEGTGIGLALTKELVELHKGKIEVESEEGKGSTFRLIFPFGKEHLKPEEICEEEIEKSKEYEKGRLIPELDEFLEKKVEQMVDVELSEKPSLLIVEDNPDVRKYISMILENHYQIFEAKDGEEGLNISFEQIPDLIISDIMMPKLDGFQMCSKIKTDSRTSHIPIIMLTAKATMIDKISGLEIGADDYIMKPFEAEELKARIKNLLEQRKRLHEHFRKYGLVELEEKNITSLDKQFLQNVIVIINEHISDTDFGVERLAEDVFVSRSLLLKKIEALIGETPNELIRGIRLNRAAKLIENNLRNISEIALEVGFSNPSYFAECFKKQFGVAPTQYHRKS